MLSTHFLQAKEALVDCEAAGRKSLAELPTKNWITVANRTMILSGIAAFASFAWALWQRQLGAFKYPVATLLISVGALNLKNILSGTSLRTRLLADSIVLIAKRADLSQCKLSPKNFLDALKPLDSKENWPYFQNQFCLKEQDLPTFKERIAKLGLILQIFAISQESIKQEKQVRATLALLAQAKLPQETDGKILSVLHRLWPAIVPKPEGLDLPAFTAAQREKWLACRSSLESLDRLFENPDTYANAVVGPKV